MESYKLGSVGKEVFNNHDKKVSSSLCGKTVLIQIRGVQQFLKQKEKRKTKEGNDREQ